MCYMVSQMCHPASYQHPTSLKLPPVENWKDSHEAVTVQWKGVGEKNAKVSLK